MSAPRPLPRLAAFDGLCYMLKVLCAPVTNDDELDDLEAKAGEIFHRLERTQLPSEQSAVRHTLWHLLDQVRYYGPSPDLWAFCFEGKFQDLGKKATHNKSHLAATIFSRSMRELSLEALVGIMDRARNEPIPDIRMSNQPAVVPLYRGVEAYRQRPLPVKADGTGHHPLSILVQQFYIDKRDWNNWLAFRRYVTHADARQQQHQGDDDRSVLLGQLARNRIVLHEYDRLQLGSKIEVLGTKNNDQEQWDNRWLLLRGGNAAHVQAILHVAVESLGDKPVDERLLLKIDEYETHTVAGELEPCGLAKVPVLVDGPVSTRLIEVEEIVDQAFVASNFPFGSDKDAKGEPAVFHDDTGRYVKYALFTKGGLHNVRLQSPSSLKRIRGVPVRVSPPPGADHH